MAHQQEKLGALSYPVPNVQLIMVAKFLAQVLKPIRIPWQCRY